MWEASLDWVKGMTVGQAKRMLGAQLTKSKFPKYKTGALDDYLSIPASFDSRTQWPGCVHPILNQGDCGSCWAFGATEALSDRICIETQEQVILSPQWLVSCDYSNYGCGGGNLDYAWEFMSSTGVPSIKCDPYVSGDNDESGNCPTVSCKMYRATNISNLDSPNAIQTNMLQYGPVETAFEVYQDFMSYKSGIYMHTSGSYLGGHAVKIIGWGNQNGTNYWIVANSWGTNWGDLGGFFWIAFGQCGIDSDAVVGTLSQ
jgi:cathepsin B